MKKLAQCYISTMSFSMSFFRLVRKHRDPEAQIRMTTRPNHQGQKKLEERKSGKYNFGVRPKAESETRRTMENIQGSLVCHVDAGVDTLSRECRNVCLETLLNRLQYLLVSLATHERD